MAPASVADLQPSPAAAASKPHQKPTVYVLDEFHPDAIAHARTLFTVVLPADSSSPTWREDATALLVRTSWLRASDIARRQSSGGEAVPKESCRGLTLRGKTGIPHERVASVDEVVAAADVLTLHVPLTAETRGLLAYGRLCAMKPEAILINAARGGIVDERDLERVLREGRIWGAGLDCHEEEPPTRERYGALWELPNVVSTPHIGAATAEAQRQAAMDAVDNLYRHLTGSEA